MATGGKATFSCCSPCSEEGNKTAATHYCVECGVYYCTRCVKCHNNIPLLRNHQVNDVEYTGEVNDDPDVTTERGSECADGVKCGLHRDRLIDTFCKKHGDVCCGACAVVKHRLCPTVSIDIAAKDFKSSPDVQKDKESFAKVISQCKTEKEKRTDNLRVNEREKQELIERLDQYEDKIIVKIKQLAEKSRQEIRGKYDENKTVIEADVSTLDIIATTYTEYVNKLDTSDEKGVFIYAMTNKSTVKDGATLLQDMTKGWRERHIQFRIDNTLENHVSKMTSLGHLGDDKHVVKEGEDECVVKEYQATFKSNVNVRLGQDSDTSVYDMCVMDNNDILLIDNTSRKLKRFDSDFQLKDELALSGHPIALCKINQHEVAVRIWFSNIVHFVSVDQTMQLTSSFTPAYNGWGMAYDESTGELFACEENKVSVYNRSGMKLRTYDKDSNGEQIFSACRNVTLCDNGRDLYVTDSTHGLIVLEKNGTLKMKVVVSGMSDVWPLCLLPGQICLVGSYNSGVIAQIDGIGKQVGNIINSKNGRSYTQCVVYDCKRSRLLIGGYPSIVSVYTISEV